MATIDQLKEQSVTETPLALFECQRTSGAWERWSTHRVTFEGQVYEARVLRHNLFEFRSGSDNGIDSMARITVELANADSHASEVERNEGWKGSRVTVRFVFFDLKNGVAASEAQTLFRGMADSPEEITESTLRLTVNNSLNLQRVALPDVRVQKRCPWRFPLTAAQRDEARGLAPCSKYSSLVRCGYSADQPGGLGNMNGAEPFTTCKRTRAECEARGMFSEDSSARWTRRFGGVEFMPPSTTVRSYGEKGTHVSHAVGNEARYNDFTPLIYGTVWYEPPIVFQKNDGNLTRIEVLLAIGQIQSVEHVVVNGIEIPLGRAGADMTGTGWYSPIATGGLTGEFNPYFADSQGRPLGDPYGSMSTMAVIVPNRVNDGRSLPKIEALVKGLKLYRFDTNGGYIDEAYSNNPAWVLLDVLLRSGWNLDHVDTASFARAAAVCEETIPAHDLYGNDVQIPRFQCNLAVTKRRSAADLVRGIRNGARLSLAYGLGGMLELRAENTLAAQQPVKPAGSNSTAMCDGGWPAYEFGDGAMGTTGILRKANGEPSIRVWTSSAAETPNRVSLEFQDAFNEYQQDSLSLVDVEDVARAGQEISVSLPALGVANFDQAARIAKFFLDKWTLGNTYVEFETSVRGVRLRPGDIITLTYLKEGFERQPFRVIRVAPGTNCGTLSVRAQIHDDAWYADDNTMENSEARRQSGARTGMPRPIAGKIVDEHGIGQFEIAESGSQSGDGSAWVTLSVGFTAPAKPSPSGLGIPLVSLAAQIDTTGGTITGDQTLYYSVSATNADGEESGLSFTIRATIPPGTNTNRVTLTGLSFDGNTTGFNVYRGASPMQVARIAQQAGVAATFTDGGLAATLQPPPDANYDHANFYWRFELLTENQATTYSATTIGNSSLAMSPNWLSDKVVRITRGLGAGQERTIVSNTETTLTVTPKWEVTPDGSSWFVAAEPGWETGAKGASGPLEVSVPTRVGATVHLSGRAANAHELECPYEISPLTRWRISGGGAVVDEDVPPEPIFGLAPRGRGIIELTGVGFNDLTNTRTITSGTLTLHYWNELTAPPTIHLSAFCSDTDTTISLTPAGGAAAGDLIQIDGEVMRVVESLSGGLQYVVTRAAEGSQATMHMPDAAVYDLDAKVFVAPFPRDFFGSPGSGNFAHPVHLADARVVSASLFVTNARGNSAPGVAWYGNFTNNGLRTLSGGQYTIQVDGFLAIQNDASPPLIVQETHSVRDVTAVVNQAPTVEPVTMDVRVDGTLYCSLTIPANQTHSDPVVSGFGKPPLAAGAELSLDITGVGQTSDASPGRDLTVTIRL